jgi:hypothetical protein
MHVDSRGYGYETFRDGGRVCRRYVCKGETAAALSYLDQIARERDEEAKRQTRVQIATLEASGAALDAYCGALDGRVSDAMTAAGYHRHKRGNWRKRRANQTIMSKQKTLAELDALPTVATATKNKRDAVALLDGMDEKFCSDVANVRELAFEGMIQICSGDCELTREAHRRQLDKTSRAIAGHNATPLENQLAQRVALCELSVARMEQIYANCIKAGSQTSVKFWEAAGRQLDAAHRRHLSAVKALATVRKAQLPELPDVQINVAEKQVNINAR